MNFGPNDPGSLTLARVTIKNLEIKVAFLLGKSVDAKSVLAFEKRIKKWAIFYALLCH